MDNVCRVESVTHRLEHAWGDTVIEGTGDFAMADDGVLVDTLEDIFELPCSRIWLAT